MPEVEHRAQAAPSVPSASTPLEEPLDGVPSATPGPVSADVQAPSSAAPSRRFDPGHPLVKLSLLAVAVAGMLTVAAVQNAPAVDAPAAASVTGATMASATPSAMVAPIPTSEPTERVAHDVDEDEQPAPRRDGQRGARKRGATTHSPDAKAGVTTGYSDGEPVRVTLTILDGKPVEEHTAAAFRKMRDAAKRDGVVLTIVSGFRTMERQKELYADYRAGRGHLAALPGHSNHQSGHALDLAVAGAKVRAWLEAHAADYGFRRTVPNEPWHWET